MAGHLDSDLEGEALDYTRCCEHPAYGFNIAPRAVTTAMEVQVVGLEVFARCGASPRYAGAIQCFVAACQTPHGGFARVPGALTRLEDTWLGLRALDCLGRLAGDGLSRFVDLPPDMVACRLAHGCTVIEYTPAMLWQWKTATTLNSGVILS